MGSRAYTQLILAGLFALWLIVSCSDNTQEPDFIPPSSVTAEIDSTGGIIEWVDVIVEIPAGAIDGSITITLSGLDYDPADSLSFDAESENTPVRLHIAGDQVQDTIYVSLPSFLEDDFRNIIGLERNGTWQPLPVVGDSEIQLRVAIPHEYLQTRDDELDAIIAQLRIWGFDMPEEIRLVAPASHNPERPALILVHGLLADANTWELEIREALGDAIGDVWRLEYPWHEAFWEVAEEAIDSIQARTELSGRTLYFLGHSKGGLLSRAIIRQMEDEDLDIRKAVFFGTPHYGAPVDFLYSFLYLLYSPEDAHLLHEVLSDFEGVEEFIEGSTALASLADDLSFDLAPSYRCIVGYVSGTGTDYVVSIFSADLAEESHAGEREEALYASTLIVSFGHNLLHHYLNETWFELRAFLSRGSITVNPYPDELDAPWVLAGPCGYSAEGSGDETLVDLPAGEYTLTWGQVEGHQAPAPNPVEFTLEHLESVAVPGQYVEWIELEGFAQIPAGTFWMGARNGELGADSDEYPRHEVTLTHPCYIQSTEVTNQQYMEMAQWAVDHGHGTATSSSLRDALDGSTVELLDLDDPDCEIAYSDGIFRLRNAGHGINPDHPVKEVTWQGAAAYCDWLSLQAGLPRAYDHSTWHCNGNSPYTAAGYRLPTEAEWEYACRAGSETAFANGEITDFGCNDPVLDLIGWYCGNAEGWTHHVGGLIPNAWGLYDMHGNLWDWCNDRFSSSYYSSSPGSDPIGPTTGYYRVVRGASWSHYARCCRSAYRVGFRQEVSGSCVGFRPARSAD